MANLRNSPPQRPRPGCSSLTWEPGPGHPHPHPPHAAAASPLASGFQEFYTRRFQLATWLLEQHNRLGAQRATSALILVLVDLLLTGWSAMLSVLIMVSIVQNLTLLRLLLLVIAILAVIGSVISALFALLSAVWLYSDGAAAGTQARAFFQSGAGVNPAQDEAHFRLRFCQVTQQQMLDGALSEVYAQARQRVRQERWLRRSMVAFAVALLLFTLTALGTILELIL